MIISPLRIAAYLLNCHAQTCCETVRPKRRSRAILLLVINIVNMLYATAGLVYQWADVSSFFLGVVISNFLVYLSYYFVMKVFVVREKLSILPHICLWLAIGFWAPALYYFTRGLTSWTDSPAVSREGNAPCILLDFFDSHDIWHMLSACGLFFGSLALLSLDDDLSDIQRCEIQVF